MNTVSIMLATEYDSIPSHCTIHVCGELIFDSVVSKNIELIKEIDRFEQFTVKVVKSGKTMDLVNKHHKQELVVQRITLNGIDLKVREFGRFELKNNPYVKEETLQTDHLSLNGEWHLELPKRSLKGQIDLNKIREELRDDIGDCDIACFGCSQTWGSFLDNTETWPSHLEKITGKSVKNFGIRGSNTNEIIALADHYVKNHKSENILLYLPHSFRRQLIVNTELLNIDTQGIQNRELVMNGEEHSISVLSGDLRDWLEAVVSRHTNIYFGTYQTTENELYRKTPLKKYMFPFLEGDNYPKASDNLHHGTEFNRDFAKMLVDFLDLG